MKEQTMCCGTTCDKENVAEYIKRLETDRAQLIHALERVVSDSEYGAIGFGPRLQATVALRQAKRSL